MKISGLQSFTISDPLTQTLARGHDVLVSERFVPSPPDICPCGFGSHPGMTWKLLVSGWRSSAKAASLSVMRGVVPVTSRGTTHLLNATFTPPPVVFSSSTKARRERERLSPRQSFCVFAAVMHISVCKLSHLSRYQMED